jgi:hypothetical protein
MAISRLPPVTSASASLVSETVFFRRPVLHEQVFETKGSEILSLTSRLARLLAYGTDPGDH